MPLLHNYQSAVSAAVRLGGLALNLCLLESFGAVQAQAQDIPAQTHVVAVQSEPRGAMIWKKEGRNYTCINTLTPGTVELAFHGENDVQRLRLRRFGFTGVNLDVKPSDKEVGAALREPRYKSFLLADDAPPDLKQLNVALKRAFEEQLLTDQDAFRCVPFELDYTFLSKDSQTGVVSLNMAIRLDRSFGGSAFRLASHAPNDGRSQNMGRVALESGIAEILGRLHRIATKFPDVKWIRVLGEHPTTEAVLDTVRTRTPYSHTTTTSGLVWDNYGGLHQRLGIIVTTTSGVREGEATVVKDQDIEQTITFVMPASQIPDTLDKKALTDAVLAAGQITTGRVEE